MQRITKENEYEKRIQSLMAKRPELSGALEYIYRYGQIEGDHHRAWVIDQVTRELLGDDYEEWVESMKEGGLYSYDEGIAP